jgi:surfactin synthase thioesterase subunit
METAVSGRPAPLRFYAAASPPPDTAATFPRCTELPDEAFIVIQTFDAPKSLRDMPELRKIFLPLLRHDLRWCEDCQHQDGLPLATTVVALAGRSDATAPPEVMAGWSRHGDQFRMLTAVTANSGGADRALTGPEPPQRHPSSWAPARRR